MAQVTVNDHVCRAALLAIPTHGVWWADVAFDQPVDDTLKGTHVTMRVDDIMYTATVYRASNQPGSYRARLVGGAGGWGKPLAGRAYSHASGVKLSLVLGDVMRETGETVSLGTDASLGAFYTRLPGAASSVLRGRSWYVDRSGVTQVRERVGGIVVSSFDYIGGHFADGRLTVATDAHEDWLPGKRFSSLWVTEKTIRDVMHTFDAGRVRTEIWFT